MEPVPQPLRMFGAPSESPAPEWAWVEAQLTAAETYWVVSRGPSHPHPRPVWGVWDDGRVLLSLGSPVVRRELSTDPRVTVHLDSGLDVVIVEGTVTGTRGDADAIAAYDRKYDWSYDAARYGPFTEVTAARVLSWRAAGPAGRDGFRETGRWRFATA